MYLNEDILLIKEAIESESNKIPYTSSDFTIIHKTLTCEAFNNILDRYPNEMIGYLMYGTRSGGFQHKIFQEYIRLLEKALPFSFRKNKKIYKIESLLDEQLCLFDGISEFDGVVSPKLEIKNGTKEIYIGGRNASYVKPFYFGKLLELYNKETKENLLDNVVEYSFSKIKMCDVLPGIIVCVSHLRIPPHYQMGGMNNINKLRERIVSLIKIK